MFMKGWLSNRLLLTVLTTATLLMFLALGTAAGEGQDHGPYFGEDSTQDVATTGDPFTFTVVSEGCTPKMVIKVIYHYEDGEDIVVYMQPVRGTFGWTITITASEAPGTMFYHFGGFDTTGGWVFTEEKTVLVLDNDPPVLISDNSGTYAEPGKAYTFDLLISDNGEIASAWVDYRYEGGDPYRLFLAEVDEDRYTMSIQVPVDGVKRLHYTVHAHDAEDNNLDTSRRSIPVVADMTPPTFGVDHSPVPGTTGDDYRFSVGVKDDFGLAEVRVTFSFGEGVPVTETMTGTRNFRFTTLVPLDCSVDLEYQFYAVDASGNSNTTLWKRVEIVDNDPPVADAGEFVEVLVDEGSHLDGTGSTDNIGISTYEWTILAYGEQTTLSGPTPTLELADPGDYNVTLVVLDAAGNSDTDHLWVRATGADPPPIEPPLDRTTAPLPIPGFLAFVLLLVLLIVSMFIIKARHQRLEP
jgi:hypothetical protein